MSAVVRELDTVITDCYHVSCGEGVRYSRNWLLSCQLHWVTSGWCFDRGKSSVSMCVAVTIVCGGGGWGKDRESNKARLWKSTFAKLSSMNVFKMSTELNTSQCCVSVISVHVRLCLNTWFVFLLNLILHLKLRVCQMFWNCACVEPPVFQYIWCKVRVRCMLNNELMRDTRVVLLASEKVY